MRAGLHIIKRDETPSHNSQTHRPSEDPHSEKESNHKNHEPDTSHLSVPRSSIHSQDSD